MIFIEELIEIVKKLNEKYYYLILETNGKNYSIRYMGMLLWCSEDDFKGDYNLLKNHIEEEINRKVCYNNNIWSSRRNT